MVGDVKIVELAEKVLENSEKISKLSERVDRLLGDGGDVGLKVGLMLKDWFRRHAPEYEVFMWGGAGGDVLIEGRRVLAAVDIAVVPKVEDVRQLKDGVGAVEEGWGKRPDLLIVYSQSGVVREDVARYAGELGVFVVRRPADVKRLMDEASKE